MDLQSEFLRLCQVESNRADVLYTKLEQGKHLTAFSLVFRICRVELVYSRKWETLAPPSVLYCRFYLSKNDTVYLHLPELIAYLETGDYRACYFPCIESMQRMEDCFRALMGIVNDYIPLTEKLGETGGDRQLLEQWATEGFFEDTGKTEEPQESEVDWEAMTFVRQFQEAFYVARHTILDAYEAFLNCDREKALKKYEKLRKGGLSLYEKGLMAFLQSEESQDFCPMPAQCHAAPSYKKAERGDRTDIKGIALLYALFSLLFCCIIAGINAFLSKDTLFFYGVDWWFGLILGFLPAMFGYFLFQRRLRTLLGGSNDFLDTAKGHPGLMKFVAVFWAATLAGCLWFCIAVPGMSFRMYETYGIYYTEEETTERFEYADVTAVYHIDVRYNVYGDPVDRASCVLILSDGRQIDLDSNGSDEEQLSVVGQLFPDLKVQYVDSDRDLPGVE